MLRGCSEVNAKFQPSPTCNGHTDTINKEWVAQTPVTVALPNVQRQQSPVTMPQ